jgi:hypothetical protein
MSLQPFNVPQLQDSGLGASASLLGSMVNSQTNLINAKKERRKDILATLIGGGANIGNQLLENKQRDQTNDVNLEIAKQKQPSRFLQQANSYATLAKAAGDAGDFAQQEQFNKLAITFGQAAMGGGGSLLGGGTVSSPNLSGGTIPAESSTVPSGGTGTTQPVAKGNEPYSIIPQANKSNFPTGVNFSTQQSIGRATKAQEEAQVAATKMNMGQGLQGVIDAPDGNELIGLGGTKFKGIKLNPQIKSGMIQKGQDLQLDPAGIVKERKALTDSFNQVNTAISQADKLFNLVKSSDKTSGQGLPAIGASAWRSGAGALGKIPLVRAGYNQADKKALGAEDILQGYIASLKTAVGDSGVLTNQDVARIAKVLPQFADDKITMQLKRDNLIRSSYIPLMRSALAIGDDRTFNAIQDRFKQLTGSYYDGYSSIEDFETKASGKTMGTGTKQGITKPATKQSSVDTSKGYKTYNVKPSSLKDELIYFNSL